MKDLRLFEVFEEHSDPDYNQFFLVDVSNSNGPAWSQFVDGVNNYLDTQEIEVEVYPFNADIHRLLKGECDDYLLELTQLETGDPVKIVIRNTPLFIPTDLKTKD